MSNILPAGFEALEPYAVRWALATQAERERCRRAAAPEATRAFYAAMVGQMEAAIGHLNAFDLHAMPEPERRLLYLTLSLAEVAPHVELYRGDPRVPYSFEEERFIAEHGSAPHYQGALYALPGRPA
jgi:selenocysteine lyase/cysteine desulfurase